MDKPSLCDFLTMRAICVIYLSFLSFFLVGCQLQYMEIGIEMKFKDLNEETITAKCVCITPLLLLELFVLVDWKMENILLFNCIWKNDSVQPFNTGHLFLYSNKVNNLKLAIRLYKFCEGNIYSSSFRHSLINFLISFGFELTHECLKGLGAKVTDLIDDCYGLLIQKNVLGGPLYTSGSQ